MTERRIHLDDLTELGVPLVDDDLIPNGLYNLEGVYGADDYPLADGENWYTAEISDAWNTLVVEKLARHGIRWNTETDEVTIPDGMPDETARRLLRGAYHVGLDAWLGDIVDEVREGRPEADGGDVRPESATGSRWVTQALEIDQ